jgi:hypothetical protein
MSRATSQVLIPEPCFICCRCLLSCAVLCCALLCLVVLCFALLCFAAFCFALPRCPAACSTLPSETSLGPAPMALLHHRLAPSPVSMPLCPLPPCHAVLRSSPAPHAPFSPRSPRLLCTATPPTYPQHNSTLLPTHSSTTAVHALSTWRWLADAVAPEAGMGRHSLLSPIHTVLATV